MRATRPELVVETRATLHSEAVPLLQALNIVQVELFVTSVADEM